MTQTEGQMTSKHTTLEVSTDNANWTDISCSSNSFDPSGGEHMFGSTHVFCGHNPLIGLGKKEVVEATVRIVYTEEESEAADLIDGFVTNQTPVWIRHRPKGAVAGAWEFVGKGYFLTPINPSTDATSADILTKEVRWVGSELPMGPQAT